jgi:hypothetical protein
VHINRLKAVEATVSRVEHNPKTDPVKRRTIDAETLKENLEETLNVVRRRMRMTQDQERQTIFGTALGLVSAMEVAGFIDAGESVRRRRALKAEFGAKDSTPLSASV